MRSLIDLHYVLPSVMTVTNLNKKIFFTSDKYRSHDLNIVGNVIKTSGLATLATIYLVMLATIDRCLFLHHN